MKVLLITFGTVGDVNPFIGLGAALKARGHSVTFATNSYGLTLACEVIEQKMVKATTLPANR